VAGGSGAAFFTQPNGVVFHDPIASAERYDPVSNVWSSAGSMSSTRIEHRAAFLPSGKVLVTGGRGRSGCCFGLLASADIYDPATNGWSPAAPLLAGTTAHTSTLLRN